MLYHTKFDYNWLHATNKVALEDCLLGQKGSDCYGREIVLKRRTNTGIHFCTLTTGQEAMYAGCAEILPIN